MYYNKFRKTLQHWWHSYLLFKCSIVVLPVYFTLIIAGLYCLIYNIDPAPAVKSIYLFILLILSAAAIFILVLLLATVKGSGNRQTTNDDGDIDLEIDLDSIAMPRRRRSLRGEQACRGQNSITRSILTAIFGNYHDDNDDNDMDEDDVIDSENILTAIGGQPECRLTMSPNFGLDSSSAHFYHLPLLSQAENRMVSTLEQATDELEYMLDCNAHELSLEDHMPYRSRHSSSVNHLHGASALPPGYHDSAFDQHAVGAADLMSGNSRHYPLTYEMPMRTLAPPKPPRYTPTQQSYDNQHEPSSSNSAKILHIEQPPTYEEATKDS